MTIKIVDVHVHPFAPLTEDQLLAELDKAGVDVAVLMALDLDPHGLERPEIKQMVSNRLLEMYSWDAERVSEQLKDFLELARTDNERVADLVEKHHDRFFGFGSIDLSKSDSYVEQKIKEIDKLGLKGIKLIPTLQFFNPTKATKNMEKLFEYCEKKEKIVTCHTGCDPYIWEEPHFSQDANPQYLKGVVQDFEKVPLVLAHVGCYSSKSPGIWLDEALDLGRNHENVWFDIAAVPYVVTREKFVDRIRKSVGLDRFLFGSDFPAVNGVSIESMIAEVRSSNRLSEEEKENILGLNATRLLGLQQV